MDGLDFGEFQLFSAYIGGDRATLMTKWRWTQSAANRSLGQIPVNREKYREFSQDQDHRWWVSPVFTRRFSSVPFSVVHKNRDFFDRIRELLGIEQGIRMRNRDSNLKPYGRYMSPVFRQLPEPLVRDADFSSKWRVPHWNQ